MFRKALLAGVATALLSFAPAALAQQEFPAKLVGHAVLPAESFVAAPADAPADLKLSGKYTTGKRVDALGTVMGKSAERDTGVKLPSRASRARAIPASRPCPTTPSRSSPTMARARRRIHRTQCSSSTTTASTGRPAPVFRSPPFSCTIPTARCRSASSMRAPRSAI